MDIHDEAIELAKPLMIAELYNNLLTVFESLVLFASSIVDVAVFPIVTPIKSIIANLSEGFIVAGEVVSGQHYKENIFWKLFALTFTWTIIVTMGAYIVLNIIKAISTNPLLLKAVDTATYAVLSMPIDHAYGALRNIVGGQGRTKLIGVLDILKRTFGFIIGSVMTLGVIGNTTGAAGMTYGYLVANALFLVIVFLFFLKRHTFHVEFDLGLAKELIIVGLPISIGKVLTSMNTMFITYVMAVFGTLPLAAYEVSSRLYALIRTPVNPIHESMRIVASKYSNDKSKIRKSLINTTKIGFAYFFVTYIPLIFLWKPLVSIFTSNQSIIAESFNFFLITYIETGFVLSWGYMDEIFRGLEKSYISMILWIVRLWIIRTPLIIVLVPPFGINGLWMAFLFSNILSVFPSIAIIGKFLDGNGI